MADPLNPRVMRDDLWNELILRGWTGRNGPMPGMEPSRDDARSGPDDGRSLLDQLYAHDVGQPVDHDPDQNREQDRGPDLDR